MSLLLENISCRFGDVMAVDRASLAAKAGEIICLYGASGCGKTTLLRIAAGLEPLQDGRVELEGQTIARPGKETPPERRPIGFVFQDFVLFPHMSVAQNIAFGLGDLTREARADEIKKQLRATRLEEYATRYPHEISGGQQQRTALARALARRPKALLLDEPFASIDTTLRRRLREDLRRMLKAEEVAVILVTHDPEEALALGDRIALMKSGRILEVASPEALFANPETAEGAGIFPGSQRLGGTACAGVIETGFGRFEAPGARDGESDLVFRAGAASAELVENAGDGLARVVDVRFIGPHWTLLLEARQEPVERVRVISDKPVDTGAVVALRLDPQGVFVFAAS